MRLLHKLVSFSVPQEDLLNIYILYIWSILEQSCQVWHSLERVQKNALRIILQEQYVSYSNALDISGLSPLFERRSTLCLRFAKSCVRNNVTEDMFPLNPTVQSYELETRFREKYKVTNARTERLKTSSIPYMQRLLNSAK